MEFVSNLSQLLGRGGPVAAVLAVLSVVAVAIVLIKLYQFAVLDLRSRGFVDEALAAVARGESGSALDGLGRSRHPIARVLETGVRGMQRVGSEDPRLREEITRVGAAQLARLESYLRGLETIGNLSPLLGLLGTVTGMIAAFQRLEDAGSRVDPAILSGGIWEALLTTAIGLVVAIPVMAVLNALEGEVDRVRREMSDAVTRLFTQALAPGLDSQPEPVADPAAITPSAAVPAGARHAV